MVCITGGGTGGHLRIVSVLREELNKLGIKPIYIGSIHGKDREWVGENPEGWTATYFLDSRGVVNQKGLKRIEAVRNILRESKKAVQLMDKHNVQKVISVGGYSAAPASFGAVTTPDRELYIHEQNSILGRLNQVLEPFAVRLFNSFFGKDPYPVDESFFTYARTRKKLEKIIFLGGSQGAHAINQIALQMAPYLRNAGIEIIHQTGARDFKFVKERYEKMGIEAEIFSFTHHLPEKLHKADLAISRAGASTLWELVSNGLPTIFVPYPYAAGNHQYFNAHYLEERGLAKIMKEEEFEVGKLLNLVEEIGRQLEPISVELQKMNTPKGGEQIVKEILLYTPPPSLTKRVTLWDLLLRWVRNK
ncbi:MAG: UDP-N-acetylglucosamine--N-acetylmuramyl-(pentapeptide) pyrophosphoryl-undecaprenol N-acetylglucosamine transferase [Epsilonproteobacteria bacterium]|jgi:UDP-N-acetylglucosamine--N-acetylmuramyl-(pentapeptide) pyrophosphoryl-undecaprenol N-acetylglucosamine transferase|nr:UDP-N-acetylglucosamine--N-acetylmuramyl-(pentapeptide) pyrophosphoryl-undecaprenol N-acetylglucosamine transferase [Campylobacterota bacterium]NPA89177.1 UDP-N-acetylglucosamine--N-acetylmuramyl-(pentapeptide) pyrophosphoryl-undecaprenol N-acetylglucosamine transferase [Campylobacterota bacterium]